MARFSGSLKQQVCDETGDYEWVRRNFELDEASGKMNSVDQLAAGDSAAAVMSTLSLVDAKYAKAWSISSAAVGYGFDIIWTNGSIVSFLAGDEKACHNWVQSINESIRVFSKDDVGDEGEIEENNNNNKGRNESIEVPPAPPSAAQQQNNQAVKPPLYPGGVEKTRASDATFNQYGNYSNSASLNLKEMSPVRGDAQNDVSDMSATKMAQQLQGVSFSSHSVEQSFNTGNVGGIGAAGGSNSNSNSDSEFFQLQQKCLRLTAKAERDAIDAQVAREQLVKLQSEFDSRSAQYGRDLDLALEREKMAVSAAQSELEMKVLRQSNENAAHHEAAMRAEREQNHREISCLKEELVAERGRYATLLNAETSAKDRAEGHEISLQQEITSLREQNQRQQVEITRLHKNQSADKSHWERERKLLIQDFETRANTLEEERKEESNETQVGMRKKLSELTIQFESRVKEIEKTVAETIRQECEGERLRDISLLEKRCIKDIEVARTEERKARAREVDSLRKSFRDRERQIAEDLTQLEKLHSERITRLEHQLKMAHKNEEDAEKVAKEATELAKKGSSEVRNQALAHMKQAEISTKKAEELLDQITSIRKELQQSRVRESTYRQQLSKALEENRLQRAELLESKNQTQSITSAAYQWKKTAQEADMTHSTSATSLHIAQDEISMLEHELARVKEDNFALQQSLDKARRAVYGGAAAPKTKKMTKTKGAFISDASMRSPKKSVNMGTFGTSNR